MNPAATFRRAVADRLRRYRRASVASAPLATMRLVVGLLVAWGALRFLAEGWVDRLLGTPFRFHFYGFAWVPCVGAAGGVALYGFIAVSALAVAVGYRYRWAAPACLAAFALAELQDATHYLNHYYLVILLLGLLCVTPAAARFSLDVAAGRVGRRTRVPAWCVHAFVAQLAIVYGFAGLAKVNADWLLRAMPLAIWLPERSGWPVLGELFAEPATAYVFSWAGCLYDLTIAGWLLWGRSRPLAYAAVLVFHGLTWLLFNIGLFPLIMAGTTLAFFPAEQHERVWGRLRELVAGARALVSTAGRRVVSAPPDGRRRPVRTGRRRPSGGALSLPLAVATAQVASAQPTPTYAGTAAASPIPATRKRTLALLGAYLAVQLALPLRALAYPGPAAWGEEGYRFGWRVMLVEKVGRAEFTVVDGATGREALVDNRAFLTAYQEKQMAIQPDFVLQFAHHVARVYADRHGFASPAVYADVRVALNGRRSRPLVDPAVDLATQRDGLAAKTWIRSLAP